MSLAPSTRLGVLMKVACVLGRRGGHTFGSGLKRRRWSLLAEILEDRGEKTLSEVCPNEMRDAAPMCFQFSV